MEKENSYSETNGVKMGEIEANRVKYTQVWRLAAYLEAEWSDLLFDNSPDPLLDNCDPFTNRVQPRFYQQIGQLTHDCVRKVQVNPQRYCDVGGATGRTLYEISCRLPELIELVLAEPSPLFCQWAERLLCSTEDLDWIPTVVYRENPSYVKAANRPEPINKEKEVKIYQVILDDVPRPPEYFDLITCLNVADRHQNPLDLVNTLGNLLQPNGLLVLSSPLEFDEKYTPDKEKWIRDLNVLFSEEEWKSIAEENFLYDLRFTFREWYRYNSQVVVKQKKS